MNKLLDDFQGSIQTGFFDKSIPSHWGYRPQLLINQKQPAKKILTSVIQELDLCDRFFISVAFVTTSGIATIINKLKELENRGVLGEILVSQYLNFTQPEALKRLSQFKNIHLKVATSGNTHSKAYIFQKQGHYSLIVGSSNLTAQALTTNQEWNLKVTALDSSGLVDEVLRQFRIDFNAATDVTADYITEYEALYAKLLVHTQGKLPDEFKEESAFVSPNLMQKEALNNLRLLREEGKKKALVISATGTGKTFLAAFDAKSFQPKRLLFVVHRLTIAKAAMNTFKRVFGDEKKMGLYSGDRRELECDFIFSTIQTISKEEHLGNFSKDHFDYIIIDESHRSGADSYTNLLNYFSSSFLLGMTATPERTDGNNIFKLFDHNIAYEIRLNRAMEEDLLCSFHYYGVTDLFIDGTLIEERAMFNALISEERVNRIIESSRFYGSDNGITRGLIFCSKVEEATELSRLFNERGYRTVALVGSSSEDFRASSIERLESNDWNEQLDFIFTVDVFNEGIDIPKVNQIIMLRPTQSSIVFVQQLGRGLRKADGKGYLTVIDFIGNYSSNYLIPMALFGDNSYNKDTLRKLVADGSRLIPGSSTVNFDQISKDRIFKAIDSANLHLKKDLEKDFELLKYKLGRLPMMMDFVLHGNRDPFMFVSYAGSYVNFIMKVEKDFSPSMTKAQLTYLELFNQEINNGKRVVESIVLSLLVEQAQLNLDQLNQVLFDQYGFEISEDTWISCIRNLNFEFVRKAKEVVEISGDNIHFTNSFSLNLSNENFSHYLKDSIAYSIYTFGRKQKNASYKNGFLLYEKYSRKDVCRILNWDLNEEATVYGYKLSKATCPIFVNYHKEEKIASSIKFPEKFLSTTQFLWYSKPNRKLSNSTLKEIKENWQNLRLPLFMKKSNGEGADFYFMGDVHPVVHSFEETTIMNDKGLSVPVVRVILELETPVESALFDYITQEHTNDEVTVELPTPAIQSTGTKVVTMVPVFNFYAAAGTFSEMQSNKDYSMIEVEGKLGNPEDYFACQVIGESMNRVIPNGALCLFKKYTGGSRNDKIVLVELMDRQDQDFNSSFTVKTYASSKVLDDDGRLVNQSVRLIPNSFDPSYADLILNEDDGGSYRVVGEFVRVVGNV
jgi:superfamily II DNA or RNA helicase/HKD family nuclease/SOS-response transcriptional repressor LexA